MKTGEKIAVGAVLVGIVGGTTYLLCKGKSASAQTGITIKIRDASGHLVGKSVGGVRGMVGAGSINLIPGNYTAQISVTNSTTTNSLPSGAVLTTQLSSTISGLLSVSDAVTYTAGQTLTKSYPFTVTSAMIGQTGSITATLLAPTAVQLATDSLNIAINQPSMAIGALIATKFYSTKVPGGAVPGVAAIGITDGEAFWADLSFQYQYLGGNYTFLAEINMGGGVYLRSYKDMTLPDSNTVATVTLTTINQDIFHPGSIPFKTPLDVRLSLIFRGQGSDWSQWTAPVATQVYTGAFVKVDPDYLPYIYKFELEMPRSTFPRIPVVDGMSVTKDITMALLVDFYAEVMNSSIVPFTVTVVITRPDATQVTMVQNGTGTSYNAATGRLDGDFYLSQDFSYTGFTQYGTYTFVATLKYNAVVVDTKTFHLVVPSVTVYGGTINVTGG